MRETETTTRKVAIVLREGVTVDSIPHIMKVLGGQVLIDIPGRPPLCLRCKRVGHVRKACKAAWCKTCRSYGHEMEECVSTYASKTRAAAEDTATADLMDIEESTQAGETASAGNGKTDDGVSPEEQQLPEAHGNKHEKSSQSETTLKAAACNKEASANDSTLTQEEDVDRNPNPHGR